MRRAGSRPTRIEPGGWLPFHVSSGRCRPDFLEAGPYDGRRSPRASVSAVPAGSSGAAHGSRGGPAPGLRRRPRGREGRRRGERRGPGRGGRTTSPVRRRGAGRAGSLRGGRGCVRGEARRNEEMPAAGSEGEEGPAGPGGGGGGPAGEQAGTGTPKLCGYLQKLSGKGPLRGFRSRWFVFDPRRCYLYYFKGPQEALPLGRIDIASACFSYHQPEAGAAAAAGDEGAAFEVHSPNGAVAVLKVGPGAGARPPSPRGGDPSPVPSAPGPAGLGRAAGAVRSLPGPEVPGRSPAGSGAHRALAAPPKRGCGFVFLKKRSNMLQRQSRSAIPDHP